MHQPTGGRVFSSSLSVSSDSESDLEGAAERSKSS